MCANYLPANKDQLAEHFKVDPREYVFKPEIYPDYTAPIIRLDQCDPKSGQLEVVSAAFGMLSKWKDKRTHDTYNSRSESVDIKPTYSHAWKERQFCIIPADTIYEPYYENEKSKSVRWAIRSADDQPLGVAGIWEIKTNTKNGVPVISFAMLTINADHHPLMKRFHKPKEEKRSVAILRPDQYNAWMHCSLDDAPNFLAPYPAEALKAAPAPKAPHKKKTTADQNQSLF